MAEYINLDNALERLLFSMCGTGYQYEAHYQQYANDRYSVL